MTFTIRLLATKNAVIISSEVLMQNVTGRGMVKMHHV